MESSQNKNEMDEVVEMIVNMQMHKDFHLPIRQYGFEEDGTQVLIKEVHRRKQGCAECNLLYMDLPIPSNYATNKSTG